MGGQLAHTIFMELRVSESERVRETEERERGRERNRGTHDCHCFEIRFSDSFFMIFLIKFRVERFSRDSHTTCSLCVTLRLPPLRKELVRRQRERVTHIHI